MADFYILSVVANILSKVCRLMILLFFFIVVFVVVCFVCLINQL